MISSYRRKFLQRFLAAIAAFLFVVSDLVFPLSVSALVPSPVLPLIQAPLPAALTAAQAAGGAAAGSALLPLVIGGLVVGAAYYFWAQSQTEQAQGIAMDKYCALYPNATVCKLPGGNWAIKVYGANVYGSPGYTILVNVPPSPPYKYRVPWDGNTTREIDNASGSLAVASDYRYDTIIGACPMGSGSSGAFKFAGSSPECTYAGKPEWKDWPASDRNSATGLLSSSDLDSIMKSNPGGSLTENQQLNDGAWVAPSDNSDFQFVPGPLTIKGPDFDNDGESDSTDPDDDNDSTPDVSDPEPKNPSIPAPAPNPSPSPSPNPNPSPSPSPNPSPSPSPSPSPNPSPPSPVAFPPVSPSLFNKPNFVQYGWQVFSNKFPLDIVGTISTDAIDACPKVVFWGKEFEVCIVRDFLRMLKIPTLISFAIWAALAL